MFNVRSIFYVLLGTIIFIGVSSLSIELINVQMTGLQVNQISRMAAEKSAELYSQETYKSRDGATATVRMPNLVAREIDTGVNVDSFYLTGAFYQIPGQGLDYLYDASGAIASPARQTELYNSLYDPSGAFGAWVNSANMGLINDGGSTPVSPRQTWVNIQRLNTFGTGSIDGQLGSLYRDTMMTPLNLGIPYMDLPTVNRMFQWHLAQLFSNCNPTAIQRDDPSTDDWYVTFKGFRIWARQAQITQLTYRAYDISTTNGRASLTRETNILDGNAINFVDLGFGSLATSRGGDAEMLDSLSGDERQRICVVGIQYVVPISYEGITPLRAIIAFFWDYSVNNVDGYDTVGGSGGTPPAGGGLGTWDDDLRNGGFSDMNANAAGSNGANLLPIPGDLVYYLIK